ncbi:MAG: hypothetical protein MI810_07870, partial [Flavobacteriales bacterium]|nr:hypothetical protein [Flavobacteriales bacterium]
LNLENIDDGKLFTPTYRDAGFTFKDYTGSVSSSKANALVTNVGTPLTSLSSNLNVSPVGPIMIGLGQPIKLLKPVGALGSKPGSSVASSLLRKAVPLKMPYPILGTRTLGGAVGRAVPVVGWGLTAMDMGQALWHGMKITSDKYALENYRKNMMYNPYSGFVIDGAHLFSVDWRERQKRKQAFQENQKYNPYSGFVIDGGLFGW